MKNLRQLSAQLRSRGRKDLADGVQAAARPPKLTKKSISLLKSATQSKIVPFSKLPKSARLAVMAYMDVSPDDYADFDEIVPASTLFGYAVVPIAACMKALMTPPGEVAEEFESFEDWLRWYNGATAVPNHGASVWPCILGDTEDELFQDGWHRFVSYVNANRKSIPVIWFAEKLNSRT